jgi:tight adherence protein B
MTSQSRISGIVIGLLPPGLAVVLSVMNPGYMQPLFTEPLGIILLIVATVMTVMGAVILMRMSKVEV